MINEWISWEGLQGDQQTSKHETLNQRWANIGPTLVQCLVFAGKIRNNQHLNHKGNVIIFQCFVTDATFTNYISGGHTVRGGQWSLRQIIIM